MDNSQEILSQITVFQKYAKYVPEIKRRENWQELVERNMAISEEKYVRVKTRSGADALIYNLNGGGDKPVHGAIWNGAFWEIKTWHMDGYRYPNDASDDDLDWDGYVDAS